MKMKQLGILLTLLLCTGPARAEVRQRGYTEVACTASGTCTVNTPSGTTNGDLMITATMGGPSTGTVTPTGWTALCGGAPNVHLYSHTASSEGASTGWAQTGTDANGAIATVSFYDAKGNTLSVDGLQYECNTSSAATNVTPTSLTAAATWEAGVVFIRQEVAGSNTAGWTIGATAIWMLSPLARGAQFQNQPASGTFTFGNIGSTPGLNAAWNYGAVLLTGAAAPTRDYRLRGSRHDANSGVTNPGNAGDLLIVGCAGATAGTTFSAPDGTWISGATDTGQGGFALFSKIATSTGGSLGAFSSNHSGGCQTSAYYDQAGGVLKVLQSTGSSASAVATATAPAITPTSVGNVLVALYFPINNPITAHFMYDPLNALVLDYSQAFATNTGDLGGSQPAPSTASYTPPSSTDTTGAVNWELATLEIGSTSVNGGGGQVIIGQ